MAKATTTAMDEMTEGLCILSNYSKQFELSDGYVVVTDLPNPVSAIDKRRLKKLNWISDIADMWEYQAA